MQKRFYTKDEGGFESMSATVVKSTSKSRLVLVFLFFLVGAGLLFVGVKLLSMQQENQVVIAPTPTPTSSPLISEAPTPTEVIVPSSVSKAPQTTPTPTVAASTTPSSKKLTISVLNGSGTAGAAGGASDALKELGYTVSFTGNAPSFTYEGITINIKKSKNSQLASLKKDVSGVGPVSSTSATLAETSTVDAQVIIGK